MTNRNPESTIAVQTLRDAVRAYADRHADQEGLAATPIPGLRMMRVYEPSGLMRSMYRPLICLVLQGAKQMTAGKQERLYSAGEVVIVGVDLPVIGRIVTASRREPYLALAIELDMAVMQHVAPKVTRMATRSPANASLFTARVDDDIVSCATRMMRLLDHPEAESVLRPALLQELHYWLLASEHGAALRALSLPDSHAIRIAKAVEHIRTSFHDSIAVEDLAARANLSPSAFHRHFRALTSLSPVQFQKQLRLIEARRLMISQGITARRAASIVGYESASQFTREYTRMFGAPPRKHVTESA
jgi:AraC-like DNA-binding protein